MKAKIISQLVFEGAMDYIHHGGHPVKTFVIEDKDNLAIILDIDQVSAFTGFHFSDEYDVIGEVDLPDKLIEKALAFVYAKAELNELKDTFKTFAG